MSELLGHARLVADFAVSNGALEFPTPNRQPVRHMGALLADSVLQAGLNYRSVVRPRVERIYALYPSAHTTSGILKLIDTIGTSEFLMWGHNVKIARFERLLNFLHSKDIDTTAVLRSYLLNDEFCDDLLNVNGVGPKTVDYLSCLVGLDSVAVDRHVKLFVKNAGVEASDYDTVKIIFSYAADLLNIPRRAFDAWVWEFISQRSSASEQFSLFHRSGATALVG
ncbi:hypothetical protein [Thalassospira sp. HF15]|uniref:hypothetical protein n=1 Tax=Thalassospira sp. HF15 TaxID=2722755 RepID=UPI00158850B3|nr:hypothetical protein [Thalassospira sp. HF15]